MLDPRGAVFRPLFTREQIGRANVPRLGSHSGQSQEAQAADLLGAHSVTLLLQLHIFPAQCQTRLDVREFALVPFCWPVDSQLREKSVGRVGERPDKAEVSRKPTASSMRNRTTEGQLLEPVILALAPWIKAQPAYKLGFVGCVGGNSVAPVERSSPPLHNAAIDVSVKCHARATIRSSCARI